MDTAVYTPQPQGMLLTLTKKRAPSGHGRRRSGAMSELTTGSDLVPAARTEGDALVATLRGEVDMHNSPELRTELLDLLAKHEPRKLVLNLAEVPYMDSSAVAVLVEAMQKLSKVHGKICLTNLQPRVKSLIEIAKLGAIFHVAADEAEAMGK